MAKYHLPIGLSPLDLIEDSARVSDKLRKLLLDEARSEISFRERQKMQESGISFNSGDSKSYRDSKAVYDVYRELVDKYLIKPVQQMGIGQSEWVDERGLRHKDLGDGCEYIELQSNKLEGKVFVRRRPDGLEEFKDSSGRVTLVDSKGRIHKENIGSSKLKLF